MYHFSSNILPNFHFDAFKGSFGIPRVFQIKLDDVNNGTNICRGIIRDDESNKVYYEGNLNFVTRLPQGLGTLFLHNVIIRAHWYKNTINLKKRVKIFIKVNTNETICGFVNFVDWSTNAFHFKKSRHIVNGTLKFEGSCSLYIRAINSLRCDYLLLHSGKLYDANTRPKLKYRRGSICSYFLFDGSELKILSNSEMNYSGEEIKSLNGHFQLKQNAKKYSLIFDNSSLKGGLQKNSLQLPVKTCGMAEFDIISLEKINNGEIFYKLNGLPSCNVKEETIVKFDEMEIKKHPLTREPIILCERFQKI